MESAMVPRVEKLTVRNLRSVGADRVSVTFPEYGVLVLLGENNAGKSNITRGLDILFGDYWPGTRRLEEHDFHGRDSDGIAVEVDATVSGMLCPYCSGGQVRHFRWSYDIQEVGQDGNPVTYRFTCSNTYCGKSWPNNVMRTALSAAVLDADRRLNYQLSYTSKYTMLSKLMHRFHERLLEDPDRKKQLAGIFERIVAEFGAVPEFANFQELLATTAEDFGQNLPYRLDIDFSAYDPSNFFRSLRIHPTLDGEVRNFDELGTGQSQVLALAFAYAYAIAYGQSEGTVLVIDEPEANLHPLAQRWLATRLSRLATPGLQVVVTTHSPHFVDLARPENLVMVSKGEGGATKVVQRSLDELHSTLIARGADPDRTKPETIGSFYAASATTDIVSGLFARRCLLVEGPTEALALPELLRARGLDVLKEGVAVVSAEGVGNIAKWYRLYTSLGVECFCLFDTDADKAGKEAADLLAKRQDIAAALGLDGDPAAAAAASGEHLHVGDGYATLTPNFEGAMRALFGTAWADLHEQAVAWVGESKPLRARYAAQRLDEFDWFGPPAASIDALVRAIRGRDSGAPPETATANHSSPSAPDPWSTDEPPF
jgi:putative ATP-dependent endonuclease of OLD family